MDISAAFCLPCRHFLQRHRKVVRWTVGLALLAGFLFWVGANAPLVTAPQMCRVYG